MCLFIDQTKHKNGKPLVAKKDIPCWKIGFMSHDKNDFYSYFRNFKYEKGYEYFITNKKPFELYKSRTIGRGFHSYRTRPKSFLTVLKFYIPKGALYYKGKDRDYVSNRIVLY